MRRATCRTLLYVHDNDRFMTMTMTAAFYSPFTWPTLLSPQAPPLPHPPRAKTVKEDNIWLGTTQGDCEYPVDKAMPEADWVQLEAAKQRVNMSMCGGGGG